MSSGELPPSAHMSTTAVDSAGAAAAIVRQYGEQSRQLIDDGNVEISGRDRHERTPPVGQGSLFARATAG